MVFPTSIPQFRAIVDVEGQIDHTFLRQMDEISGDIDRSVRGIARFHTGVTRLTSTLPEFRELGNILRKIVQSNNEISRIQNRGYAPSASRLAARDDLIVGAEDPTTGRRAGGLNQEIKERRNLLRDQDYSARNRRRLETNAARDKRRLEEKSVREGKALLREQQALLERASREQRDISRDRIRNAERVLEINRSVRRRAGQAAEAGNVDAAKQLLRIHTRIGRQQVRQAEARAKETGLSMDVVQSEKVRLRVSRDILKSQQEIQDAENRGIENRIAAARRQQRLDRQVAQERLARLETTSRRLSGRATRSALRGEFRQTRRIVEQRSLVNKEVARTRRELAKLLPDTARIGRHLLDWREVAGQFVNRILEAISRNRELRDAIIGVGISLAVVIGGARLLSSVFRGAEQRARLIQRAVFRGGLINREETQAISRAILLRGSTREDATEFVAQLPSGVRADIGDPVERQNIQDRISRLGVTKDDFDLGEIVNLPDKDLFEQLFKLADTIYKRTGQPSSVATLGKILGIDEQEARTLTHLVQSRGGIEKLIQDIDNYKAVSDETVLTNLELSTTYIDLRNQVGNLSDIFVATLAPSLITILGAVRDVAINTRAWLQDNRQVVRFILGAMVGGLTSLAVILIVIRGRLILQAGAWVIVNALMAANAILAGQWHLVAAAAAVAGGALAGGLLAIKIGLSETEEAFDSETRSIDKNTEALNRNQNVLDDRANILRLLERKAIVDSGTITKIPSVVAPITEDPSEFERIRAYTSQPARPSLGFYDPGIGQPSIVSRLGRILGIIDEQKYNTLAQTKTRDTLDDYLLFSEEERKRRQAERLATLLNIHNLGIPQDVTQALSGGFYSTPRGYPLNLRTEPQVPQTRPDLLNAGAINQVMPNPSIINMQATRQSGQAGVEIINIEPVAQAISQGFSINSEERKQTEKAQRDLAETATSAIQTLINFILQRDEEQPPRQILIAPMNQNTTTDELISLFDAGNP